jgi:hypothetical protein
VMLFHLSAASAPRQHEVAEIESIKNRRINIIVSLFTSLTFSNDFSSKAAELGERREVQKEILRLVLGH